MVFGRILRRILVVTGRVLAVVAIMVLLGIGVLLIPGVRGRVLDVALQRAGASLPGTFAVGTAHWPAPDRIELADIVWTDRGDTLLAAQRLVVEVALKPLLSRDVHLHALHLQALRADWPRLRAALPAGSGATGQNGGRWRGSFPRGGALPQVPSVAIDDLAVSAPALRVVAGKPAWAATLRGRVDVLAGHEADARIDTLRVQGEPAPGWPLVLRADTPSPRRIHLVLARAGAAAPVTRDPGLEATVTYESGPGRGLRLGLDANLRTPTFADRPSQAGTLDATVQIENGVVTVDSLKLRLPDADADVRGRFAPRAEPPITASLTVTSHGHTLVAGLDYAPADSVLHVTPIVVTTSARARPRRDEAATRQGRVTLRPGGRFDVQDLIIEGDAGEVTVDGTIAPADSSRVTVTGRWQVPPPILLDALPVAARDSLRAAWPTGETPALRIDADVARHGEATHLRTRARFDLPGATTWGRAFAAPAPEAMRGMLHGDLVARATLGGGAPVVKGTLDLTGTRWLSAGRLSGSWRPGTVVVDSAALVGGGVNLHATGGMQHGTWDLHARATVDWPEARGWAPTLALADLDASAAIDATLSGRMPDVVVDATLKARAQTPDLSAPAITGTARVTGDRIEMRLRAPEGMSVGTVVLDSAMVNYRTVARSSVLPAEVALAASGPDFGWRQRARIDADAGITLHTDSLAVRAGKLNFAATQPFTIRRAPAGLTIDGLALAGSGHLAVDGYVSRDSLDLRTTADLELPSRPTLLSWPAELWPQALQAQVTATSWRDLRGRITARGLPLSQRGPVAAALAFTGDADATDVTFQLDVGDSTACTSEVQLPQLRHLLLPSTRIADVPVSGTVRLRRCPVPRTLLSLPGDKESPDVDLDGSLALRGTASAPALDADLRLSFPAWPQLSSFAFGIDGHLRPPAADSAGVQMRLTLDGLGRRLLSGSLVWPGQLTLAPPGWRPQDAGLDLSIGSADLPLANFSPLLPASTSLEGTARVQLAAKGSPAGTDLEGTLELKSARVALADGNRVTGSGKLQLRGTASAPQVDGDITIAQGLILIPEAQRNLLPTSGASLLWQEQVETASATDSTRAASVAPPPARDIEAPPGDVDVTVTIPSGLQLRGRGLDAELSGKLRVQRQQQGLPTVVGQLETTRGTLRYLGRIFTVDRGVVTFYGDDTLNPTLDISLSCRVQNYQITIDFTGTALKPKLALSSSPALEEGDIMAVLLFGEQLDNLDTDQLAFVRKRAGDMLALYGTGVLGGQIAQQLGLDMVTITSGRAPEEGNALVVTKYLSQHVLLRYEQALSDWGLFFLTLEYRFFGNFDLQTVVGRDNQGGAELKWAHDY